MPDYPTTSFNPATRSAGQTIAAAHVNDVQSEIRAIELALISTGLAHHLLFVDATYDIGASGATRPRDLFLSRNATVGGTLAVTGLITATVGFAAANLYINDSANTDMTVGLTINQGANDNQILALKSSDVAHGVTTVAETDSYGLVRKDGATVGGLHITGFSEDATSGITLRAIPGVADTVKSTAGGGAVTINGQAANGTGVQSLGANGNIVAVRDNDTTRFILDADGDSHQDVGTAWTNFDDDDDVARLDAVAVMLARDGDPLRGDFVRHCEQHRAVIEAMPGKPLVTFCEDGHHFVNMSRLAMLLTGAVRQLARGQQQLANRVAALDHTARGAA